MLEILLQNKQAVVFPLFWKLNFFLGSLQHFLENSMSKETTDKILKTDFRFLFHKKKYYLYITQALIVFNRSSNMMILNLKK